MDRSGIIIMIREAYDKQGSIAAHFNANRNRLFIQLRKALQGLHPKFSIIIFSLIVSCNSSIKAVII